MHRSCCCHLLPRLPHPLCPRPLLHLLSSFPPPPLQPAALAPPGPALQVPPCSHTVPLQQPELRGCRSASRRTGSAVPHGNFPAPGAPVLYGARCSPRPGISQRGALSRLEDKAEPPGGGHSPQESPAAPSGNNGGGRGAGSSITDGGDTRQGRGALPLPLSPCPAPPAGLPGRDLLRWPPPALLSWGEDE